MTIAISCSIALAIRSAANTARKSGLESQSITAAISLDRTKLMDQIRSGDASGTDAIRETLQQYAQLSLEEMLTYADSDYVKEFYYTESLSLNAGDGIEAYSTQSTANANTNSQQGGQRFGGFRMEFPGGISIGDFTLIGYSSESAMTKFTAGESKITDGEMIDLTAAAFSCLISNELAVFNQLNVGDAITLTNPNAEEESYTLQISGIYTNQSSLDSGNQMRFSTAQDPANQIYISYPAVKAIKEQSKSLAVTSTDTNGNETSTELTSQVSGTYVFASKDNYDQFASELSDKGLSEYYTVSSSDINQYEASLVPLENLSQFATTLLLVVLSVGAVILVVINIFNIRERKYEVGVLTAIGIKKYKVAAQFIVELFMVTVFAVCIGTAIGAAASVPVSNQLLQSQIDAQTQALTRESENFGRGGFPGGNMPVSGRDGMVTFGRTAAVDYIDSIHATIDLEILGQLMGIGIVLTLLSSAVGVIFVMRYEPLKILAERS